MSGVRPAGIAGAVQASVTAPLMRWPSITVCNTILKLSASPGGVCAPSTSSVAVFETACMG